MVLILVLDCTAQKYTGGVMFQGSIVALVTPMLANGETDNTALANLIEFHISQGTQAIVIAGTTGEAGTLTSHEKHHLIQHAIQVANGRIAIIAGTSAVGTQQTIELTEAAARLGVDGCLIMTPAYVKPTQAGLYQHYAAIANAVAIPQILYNVPERCVCDLLPETVVELAKLPNIVAIKEASGDPKRSQQIIELCQESLAVLSGEDANTLAIMQFGGKGVISVTANVVPELSQALCEAALQGDMQQANAINQQLMPLHQVLFIETNPIPVKWALYKMGMIESSIRLPLTVLSEPHQAEVQQALQQAGVELKY